MKKTLTMFLGLFFIMTSVGFLGAAAADQDRKGSKDHPLLSRMAGFHITGYADKDFDSYKFLDKDGKQNISVEGHFYSIEYSLDRGATNPGALKVIRNIQNALQKVGGKVVFDSDRVSTVLLQKEGKETWIEVRPYSLSYMIKIVEKEAMKQEVVADAAAMGNDIRTTGHILVYGIHFDTGKSEIKPESEAALSEIAKLLKSESALQLYVVGHTDNVGSFESNMKLSKDRADAVVKALSGKYAIVAARLKPHGVASLAPVSSNDTEEGKAKNRRVELVKQ